MSISHNHASEYLIIFGGNTVKQKVMNVVLAALVLMSFNVKSAEMQARGTQTECDAGERLLGGWANTEVTPEVEAALDFVLERMNTSAELEKILGVKTQVVAGINYAIDFQLDNGEVWNTMVFRDLSGNYSMTKPATRGAVTDNCP
jgi:cystatin-like protein